MRWRGWLSLLSVVAIASAGGLYYRQTISKQPDAAGSSPERAAEPVPILVATADTADVPVLLSGIGTVQAYKTVNVRAQVSGKLLTVSFDEGEDVAAGAVLATIDPVIYQAAYDQAVAKRAMDQAQLDNAKRDLQRYTNLAKTDYVTKQQADTTRATVAQLTAQLRQDEAAIDSAKADLDRTEVQAPIAGRTGLRQIDEGNLVSSTDATPIVVITQLQPISVVFTLPETQVGAVNAALRRGAVPLTAIVGQVPQETGTLEVVDNQVDPATGTIRLKGTFANTDLKLWPGQFVNVRLELDILRDATVVPLAAVQQGPEARFVYAVTDDERAELRTVEVVQEDEMRAVIGSGVAAGERVAISGLARLQDGTRVRPQEQPEPPVASAATAPVPIP